MHAIITIWMSRLACHHHYAPWIPHVLFDLAGAGDMAEWQVMGGGCVL